jgi:hypothetical protein
MFTRPSFFALIVQPSASEKISAAMSRTVAVALPGLALLDEPGVLGEAAGVEDERHGRACSRAEARMFSRLDGLAAAGVVRDGDHDERDAVRLCRESGPSSARGRCCP